MLHLLTRRLARGASTSIFARRASTSVHKTDRRPLSWAPRTRRAAHLAKRRREESMGRLSAPARGNATLGRRLNPRATSQVPRRWLALGDHFFSDDGALRHDPVQLSHFELLGLPKGLDVDDDALDEGLRVLQRRLHPDRFATSTQEQRDLADAASSIVNGATAVLRDDLKRADYLLLLETGTSVLDDETRTAPPSLLMEVMEVREAIDEATDGGALEALVAANDVKVEDAKARLRAEVDGGDLEAASNVVVELNFYGKIEGEALAKADGEGWSVAFGDRRRQA